MRDSIHEDKHPEQHIRSSRQRFPLVKLEDYEVFPDNILTDEGELVHMVFMADLELVNWQHDIQHKYWKDAMTYEISALERNKTWKLVDLPSSKQLIGVKWVHKLKPNGGIAKYKAKFLAVDFLRRYGVDCIEVHALVDRM